MRVREGLKPTPSFKGCGMVTAVFKAMEEGSWMEAKAISISGLESSIR